MLLTVTIFYSKLVLTLVSFKIAHSHCPNFFLLWQNPINSTYVFQLTLLIQLCAYCTCGQLVLNKVLWLLFYVFCIIFSIHHLQGENVARAIYCSNWYKIADPKQRQWIQMFILGAQTRNGLSAMNIFQFSFVSLTNVMCIFNIVSVSHQFSEPNFSFKK